MYVSVSSGYRDDVLKVRVAGRMYDCQNIPSGVGQHDTVIKKV